MAADFILVVRSLPVEQNKLAEHQHCQQCSDMTVVQPSQALQEKHNRIVHQPHHCDCGVDRAQAHGSFLCPEASLRALIAMLQMCPLRVVCCRYCYLNHPAGPPNPSHCDHIAGLTKHEVGCQVGRWTWLGSYLLACRASVVAEQTPAQPATSV